MTDLRALLEEISVARLVGTPHHARVREVLKRELGARGFVVLEQRFRTRPRAPLWGGAASDAVNLIAVRPRARVTAWLAAHYDSKGQAVSMAARLVLAGVVVAGLLAALVARVAGAPTLVLAIPAALVALFVALSRISDDSPGAVDNGAGVLTVLAIVDALPSDARVGVVFPDAEEHGLVGARALVRERAHLFEDTALINFDGIDDRGRTLALVHRGGPLVDAVVRALAARRARVLPVLEDGLVLAAAARECARRARVLPVLEDGLVLAAAARECVTVMRGDWETARVVHTPRDTADRLTLEGVREVARAVCFSTVQCRAQALAWERAR